MSFQKTPLLFTKNIYIVAKTCLMTKLMQCSRYTGVRFYAVSSIFLDKYKSHEIKNNSHTRIIELEKKFKYFGHPDSFGSLAQGTWVDDTLEDEGDKKEHEDQENLPMPSQKLTIKQYSDLIKQYIKYKRLKEALDVLEVRMLKVDRVKPENYIYNILIGACAEVGYTKKAFKLYNDMKKRALKPTGDTYTCLFDACAYSPWPANGLKYANNLRELMIMKGIEPNLTNYNAMIKAFGRCGDLRTALKIVDEMICKKIKIRVHTTNHLLQACISDKENGLRYALVIWRKMLKRREKPNIYSFNLMLKCVKECNLGSQEEIKKLVHVINEHVILGNFERKKEGILENNGNNPSGPMLIESNSSIIQEEQNNNNNISFQIVNMPVPIENNQRTVPNLLSRELLMHQVLDLQIVHTPQDKFAIVGGQDDFLNEMKSYSIPPNIKTFTLMLPLIEETREAEQKLLETMKSQKLYGDIDFYNMLIKKRCMRYDYEGAFEIKGLIEKESKHRERKFGFKKKLRLRPNIMTYGVLAMACQTKESAEKLVNEMVENRLKVNAEVLGTLLRQATIATEFDYVYYILKLVENEKLPVNNIFLKHLENFNDKCVGMIKQNKKMQISDIKFKESYRKFSVYYTEWLKQIDVQAILKKEHPWEQFKECQPETIQREPIKIIEPKRYYKRNRRYVPYRPII